MPGIITITLNSAIDQIYEIETFKTGMVAMAKNSDRFAAGKAVNSARTISCLNHPVTIFCFVGKNEAHHYRQLKSGLIDIFLFETDGNTRSNITVMDSNHQLVIHLRTKGYELDEEILRHFSDQLEIYISAGDIIIISGGIPEGVPDDFCRTLIQLCHRKGARVIFDSSGKHLKSGLEALPYAIKPNVEELEELSGKKISTVADMIRESRHLNETGIEMVFVSRGDRGVLLTRKGYHGYWTANVKLHSVNPEGAEVGCGDAMVGGIAVSLCENDDTEGILRRAVACGAANMLSKGPGICRLTDVEALSREVVVREY